MVMGGYEWSWVIMDSFAWLLVMAMVVLGWKRVVKSD